MAIHEISTVNNTDALEGSPQADSLQERQDSAASFELVRGRLELCGHTWHIPIRPHWSEDPFKDHEWRRQYQSLSWLAPLRRRAIAGDLNARQAWWWLAATWLESLDRLAPGEATPWREDVASVRACELVAGLQVVGRQPWLLAAITTHLSWLDATAEQSESSDAGPLTLAARYVCHRVVGDTARAEECFMSLADWRADHFSQVGAPYPDSAEASALAVRALETVESCLTAVSAPLPWTGQDHGLAKSLASTQAKQVNDSATRIQSGSGQGIRPSVLDTARAAYVGVSGTPAGGGFIGFEESSDASTVEVTFAHGGRVWVRGAVPFDGASQESHSAYSAYSAYSVRTTSDAFEIGLDRVGRHDRRGRHRLIHSLSTGVSVWESDTEQPFDLPAWFETVDVSSDLAVKVSPGSIRLTSDNRAFFLVRLPAQDTPDDLASTIAWNPSFRLHAGPWHTRLIDVLHQSGPATAQLTTERLSRLAGPSEPDGDLLAVYTGAGWQITSNRTVLRAEQSRVPGAGRLVLMSLDGKHMVSGRGSRSKIGYLNIGEVPDGEYELLWIPVDGPPRQGPRLIFTDDAAALLQ